MLGKELNRLCTATGLSNSELARLGKRDRKTLSAWRESEFIDDVKIEEFNNNLKDHGVDLYKIAITESGPSQDLYKHFYFGATTEIKYLEEQVSGLKKQLAAYEKREAILLQVLSRGVNLKIVNEELQKRAPELS